MLKVTYKVLGNFSLKRYSDGHLAARSYPYATTSSLRGSLLGSIIQRKGRTFAKENFHKLKNVQIFIQYPKEYKSSQYKMKMFTNGTYSKKGTNVTVGMREYVSVKEITFYVDETLENIIEYLENIHRIGNSESMVQLHSIEKVSEMKDILMEWNKDMGFDLELVEDYDWDTGSNKKNCVNFDSIYLFSKTRTNNYKKKNCFIKSSLIISNFS